MLSKISQRKTNTVWFHLYVETKKQNKQQNWNRLTDTENKCMVAKGDGGREMSEIGERD